MKIFIAGGLGFIGGFLMRYFLSRGYQVSVVGLRAERPPYLNTYIEYIYGDTTHQGEWMNYIPYHDVVINLAGASIFQRWDNKVKHIILDSRVKTTKNIVEALPLNGKTVLVSASAVGYYGDGGERSLTEDDPPGNDFLANVCIAWEREAWEARSKGYRVVISRFGIVLEKYGGALAQMLKPFRYGLGGVLGSGNQWFSWIHLEDLARAIEFTIVHSSFSGPVNVCAPYPIRNKTLARILANMTGKPAIVKVPKWLMRVVFGEVSSAITANQRVIPEKLLRNGFVFLYPDIERALKAILAS